MDGHLSGVVDSVDRVELSAQRDRVSGVFSRWDVTREDTLVPKVRMCRRCFLLLGRKPWGIALRDRSFESGATMMEIQFPIRVLRF